MSESSSSRFFSDLFLFCSFIVSHPIYFSYFLFFSPYLFKLLFFLSPLFITTSILVLVLFGFSPVFERFSCRHENDDELGRFEELDAYKIVFEMSCFEFAEIPVEDKFMILSVDDREEVEQSRVVTPSKEEGPLMAEVKTLEGFLQEKEVEEDGPSTLQQKEAKEVKPLCAEPNKVEEEQKEIKPYTRTESKALSKVNSQRSTDSWYSPDNSQTFGSNLGTFGSMRKEKEWRRTLACKLFEERHNADGGEGMDLLWETYETDSIKKQDKSKKSNSGGQYGGEDDDDDEEGGDGQLCCLQALKFSAGKMNLGMGRPNLVKISKAIKGMGWLHHVSRHKKVHH